MRVFILVTNVTITVKRNQLCRSTLGTNIRKIPHVMQVVIYLISMKVLSCRRIAMQRKTKRGVLFSLNQCWTSLNRKNHGGGRKLLMS